MQIGQVDVVDTAKTTVKEFQDDDLMGLSAEVAFNLLFSIVPLLIFLTALSGFASRSIGTADVSDLVIDWLFERLPASAATAVEEPIRRVIEQEQGGLLSIGAVLALWAGRGAVASLMKALNVAFEVKESRPWLKRNLLAIGLTAALGAALIVAALSLFAGQELGTWVAEWVGAGGAWETLWVWLRWPLVAILLAVALAVLYWAGPNVDAPFKWLTPGSILSVVLVVLATYGIGLYFRFGAGWAGAAYGALGGLLAFVFWLRILSLIILLGGELNAVLTRRQAPRAVEHRASTGDRRATIGERRAAARG